MVVDDKIEAACVVNTNGVVSIQVANNGNELLVTQASSAIDTVQVSSEVEVVDVNADIFK